MSPFSVLPDTLSREEAPEHAKEAGELEIITTPALSFTKTQLKQLLSRPCELDQCHTLPHLFNPDLLLNTPPPSLKKSAVCILIAGEETTPSLLFTLRSSALQHHQGEVAFPGGLQEESDINAIETALRETEEEIGLHRSQIEVIDSLPPLMTMSGYHITPIIGFASITQPLFANQEEVEEVFYVPLDFLLNPDHAELHQVSYQNALRSFYSFEFEQKRIWGITAAIVQGLYEKILRHLSKEPEWNHS
jgi:8-oxo-dGTP pyrophosphatase MutT (NUDIX family)